MDTSNIRELAIDELDQVSGAITAGGLGAPVLGHGYYVLPPFAVIYYGMLFFL